MRKSSGWALAALSVFGLASSMVLRVYLDRAHLESPTFDALKSLLFWGEPGEPAMHAPPLINLSHANTLLGWAALNGIVAAACLVWASRARDRSHGQPRAVAIVVSLLAFYCLWHLWPSLARIAQFS